MGRSMYVFKTPNIKHLLHFCPISNTISESFALNQNLPFVEYCHTRFEGDMGRLRSYQHSINGKRENS